MQRLVDEVGADDRADGGQLALGLDRAELGLEGDDHLAELPSVGSSVLPTVPRTARATARRTVTGWPRLGGRPTGGRGGWRGEPDGAGDPVAPGDPDGAAAGAGGRGGRRLEADRLGLDLDEARVPSDRGLASRPFSSKTATTCSGVTVGSSNLISQRVPPV